MVPLHSLTLFVLLALVVALIVRYFYWTVENNLKDLSKLETDPEFRRDRIAALSLQLNDNPNNCNVLRERADALRLDGNPAAAAADLQHLATLEPMDDTVWHELAECLLELGDARKALEAAKNAVKLDENYVEYYTTMARAAILAADLSEADAALRGWARLENAYLARENARDLPKMLGKTPISPAERDPLLPLLQAAAALAAGEGGVAADRLAEARELGPAATEELLASDPALSNLSSFADSGA